MTLPNLNNERLDQMIHFACSCSQECRALPRYALWAQRVKQSVSRRMAYGMGATALSASCIALFLATPTLQVQTDDSGDITISDYMMQDLLESLT